MKWLQKDNELFAKHYGCALHVLDEYLSRREIETVILAKLILTAKKEIEIIERELKQIEQ